ncbi:UDP pyrophosphate phosphatase [Escherichia coli]|nr:UDP pyrophosphate phosphatase [Escherichia coli]
MKVSVPGMPATLLNMSNNDIYKMVSGDKMDVKMNIFQRLWETLRHLFWSDKQNSLELFNELKTCAKNPDEMVAKGKMRWVAEIYGDIELSVTFFIENKEICTQTLQLHKGPGNLGVDLGEAYLPGVDMRDCYFGKKTIIDSNENLYMKPGWNANLDGATLDGAILDGATVDGATRLYAEVIIINKITPKKIVTEGVATKQSTAEKLLPTQLLNDPE